MAMPTWQARNQVIHGPRLPDQPLAGAEVRTLGQKGGSRSGLSWPADKAMAQYLTMQACDPSRPHLTEPRISGVCMMTCIALSEVTLQPCCRG